MEYWKSIKLIEITNKLTKGTTPTTLGLPFAEKGINFIKSECITNSRILNREKYAYIDISTNEKLKRSQIEINDILFSMAGMFLGKTAIACNEDIPANTNQAVAIIRVNNKLAYYKFIYYFLNLKLIQDYVKNSTAQSAQPNINLKQIGDIVIKLPYIKEQKAIADTLSCLDDKIELNNAMNKKLEEMVQAIFKSWFVSFEPFQDGEFENSELGMIPKGWRVDSLDYIANYLNGLAMQNYRTETDEFLPVIKIKELNQGFSDINSDKADIDIPEQYIINDGDILFSWSGTLMVKMWVGGIGGLNQHLFKVTSDKYEKWFYYFWTIHHLEKFKAIAQDKATTMGHIKRSHLTESKVLIPETTVLNKMNDIMSPILNQMINCMMQNKRLIQLRDTLIPKLMSGEVRVPFEEVQ